MYKTCMIIPHSGSVSRFEIKMKLEQGKILKFETSHHKQLVCHFYLKMNGGSIMNGDILILWCEATVTTDHIFIKRNEEFSLWLYFLLNGSQFSPLRFRNDVTDIHFGAEYSWGSLLRPLETFLSSPSSLVDTGNSSCIDAVGVLALISQ